MPILLKQLTADEATDIMYVHETAMQSAWRSGLEIIEQIRFAESVADYCHIANNDAGLIFRVQEKNTARFFLEEYRFPPGSK